jgi:hypothetical protein
MPCTELVHDQGDCLRFKSCFIITRTTPLIAIESDSDTDDFERDDTSELSMYTKTSSKKR